ncbi:hypothetical protein H4S08_002809 [Coemansia sp. RSA 1365]|nr:hypothetical protein H4S08_002809 [Coemansia sp. RSA 1365]
MKWSVQVIKPSTHNSGSTSILVNFTSGRYLFNCGEGAQRLSFENRARMSKLTAVFLTRVDWDCMGGLPGMLLTLADAGARNMTICGGHNLVHALAATRHFVLRSDMGVAAKELRDGDAGATFQDENITVTPVHVYPDRYMVSAQEWGPDESREAHVRQALLTRIFGVRQEPEPRGKKGKQGNPQQQQRKKGYYSDQCKDAVIEERLQRLEQQSSADASKKRVPLQSHDARQSNISEAILPKTQPTPCVISYIVEGPMVPGRFDPTAAKALGLKPGPQYGALIRGECATTSDGSIIRPEQCVGPSRASGIFIFIDCPSPDYILALTTNPKFTSFLEIPENQDDDKKNRLLLVIHSLGPGVVQDERYKTWASLFPKHVQHMVSAPEYVPDNNPFQRHLRIQTAMSLTDPLTFIRPQASDKPDMLLNTFIESDKLVIPHFMTVFDMEPTPRLDLSSVPLLLTPDEMENRVKTGISLQTTTSILSATEPRIVEGEDGPVVCPIGTGASIPNLYRNVSANIVCVRGYGGIILDCGESTVSLLKRFLGYPSRNQLNMRIKQNYIEFMTSLRFLFISHMHADHHLGTIQLLHEWNHLTRANNPQPRLTILAPARFWVWLEDYAGVQDLGLDRVDFISCRETLISGSSPGANYAKNKPVPKSEGSIATLKNDLGLSDISTCSVVHCPWAYGVSLTHTSGWKLVYSGDTRPCANLVDLGLADGKPPTILLHEATLPDELRRDAVAKRHSTISEAVAMALGMGAENLLLTHFSQRCLTLPRWEKANIEAVKLSRYGYIAGGNNPENSSPTVENNNMDESDVVLDEIFSPDDTKGAKDTLLKELDNPLPDEFGIEADAVVEEQSMLGKLRVATAFDMSVYAPSDIDRYRYNVPMLRKALYDELTLFVAEENSADDTLPNGNGKTPQKAAKSKSKATKDGHDKQEKF